MTSTKRISDLESSVLYLENRNSELEEQVQKSVENNEKLSERLDLLESKSQSKDEIDTKELLDEMKNIKSLFLEVLGTCESFECRVSLLEMKFKDCNDGLRILKNEQTNLDEKIVKAEKLVEGACENIRDNSRKASQHFVKEVEKLEDKLKILLEDKIKTLSGSTAKNDVQKKLNQKLVQDFQGAPVILPPSLYHLPPTHPQQVATNQPQQLFHMPANFYQKFPQPFPAKIIPGVPYPLHPVAVGNTKPDQDVIENSVVGGDDYVKLVGREGKTINQIREQSGATIIIKEKCGMPPNKHFEVEYKGNKKQIEKAKKMVSNVLHEDTKDKNRNENDFREVNDTTMQNNNFQIGVRIECRSTSQTDCICKIHQYKPSQNDIMLKIDLNETVFGRNVIRNVRQSLGLTTDNSSYSSGVQELSKATLYKGSFISYEFEVSLDEKSTSSLQTKFKILCSQVAENQEQDFPELNEPEEIADHKVNLTSLKVLDYENIRKKSFVCTFNSDAPK